MKKFEYKRINLLNSVDEERELNKLGAQGWELVAIVNTANFYLKREI